MEGLSQLISKLRHLPFGPGVQILRFDKNGIVALQKPIGVMSHPNDNKDMKRALLTTKYCFEEQYFKCKAEDSSDFKVWLLNRLDSATSGVILVSLNPNVNDIIKKKFRQHDIQKTYQALVFGNFDGEKIWKDNLLTHHNESRKLRTSIRENGDLATTHAHLVKKYKVDNFILSMIELNPISGRTHQLRVQCKHHNFPIVGDHVYGNFGLNRFVKAHLHLEDRLFLHATKLSFTYIFQGRIQKFEVESPVPDSFLVQKG